MYAHINKINGKIYIGQTRLKPEKRWRNGNGYKESVLFWRAIQKYGWDNFDHEIIASNLTKEEADNFERLLIDKLQTQNNKFGYNLTGGGDGSGGTQMSKESRQKMSEIQKTRLSDPTNHPFYGKHLPHETIEKIRKTLTGKMVGDKNPNFGNHKLAGENNPMYGKHLSDEAKEKLRIAHLGKKLSIETKIKFSEQKMGYKNTRANAVYCIELDEIFWGAKEATLKYGINRCCIGDNCRGVQKSAGKHPITGEPLHWLYVNDQLQKDNTIIQGAITLGYTTQKDLDNYIKEIKGE